MSRSHRCCFCSAVVLAEIVTPFTTENTCRICRFEVLPHQLAAASQIHASVTEVRSWPRATQPVLLEELNAKRHYAEMQAWCQCAARCWKNLSEPQEKKMKTPFLCQHTNSLHSWCPSVRDATCWSSRKGTLGPGHVKVAVKQHAAKEHPPNCPRQGPRSHAELDTYTVFGPSRCLGWLWGEHEMAVSCMDPTCNMLPLM